MNAYIDSNILISYVWYHYFADDKKKIQPSIVRFTEAMTTKKFNPIVSNFALMEVAKHLKDYYILLKVIQNGFGYREFSRLRVDYSVDNADDQRIKDIINDIQKDQRFSYMKFTSMETAAFNNIELYIDGYIDFIDAFHLQLALTAKCDYLVTKDNEFRSRVKQLAGNRVKGLTVKVMNLDEFLRAL